MALKDMAYTPEEAKASYGCGPADPDDANLPKYPWGLSLSLDNDILAKLGITQLPNVGATMMLVASAKITGVSSREVEGAEPRTCLDIQITAMDMASTLSTADMANKLYGG